MTGYKSVATELAGSRLEVSRCRMQLKSQRTHDAQNGGKFGVPGRRKGFVQAFSCKPCFSCELRHTFGPRNVSQRCCEKRRIAFLKGRFKIGCHVFIRLKMFRSIPDARDGLGRFLGHFLLRIVARQFLGFPDVACLRGFVTTGKQQDIVATVLNEVHPVAWPVVDLQLRDTFANRFDSAEITERQAPDSDIHPDTCRSIFQRCEPLFVFGSLADFGHGDSVSWDTELWFFLILTGIELGLTQMFTDDMSSHTYYVWVYAVSV